MTLRFYDKQTKVKYYKKICYLTNEFGDNLSKLDIVVLLNEIIRTICEKENTDTITTDIINDAGGFIYFSWIEDEKLIEYLHLYSMNEIKKLIDVYREYEKIAGNKKYIFAENVISNLIDKIVVFYKLRYLLDRLKEEENNIYNELMLFVVYHIRDFYIAKDFIDLLCLVNENIKKIIQEVEL